MQIFKKFVQLIGFFEREAAAARAAQRGEVRPAAERLSDLVGQRADVGSLAATHADTHPRQVVFHDLHFVNVDQRLAYGDLLAGAGQFVGPCAVDLLGRVDGRGLEPLAGERGEGFGDRFPRDVLPRVGPVYLVFQIVARGRGAQHHVGHILLLLGLQGVDEFGGAADADQQDARGQRVERPGVSDLDFAVTQPAEREFDFAHHVGRGPAQGLVHDGDVSVLEIDAAEVQCFFHQQK